jgi:CheY-like chemotaxis protein
MQIGFVKTLFVDDNQTMRILIREMLRGLGLTNCQTAGSAEESMEILRVFMPDLVITDLALGGEDGISLTRRIRASRDNRLAHVPIIMLSGHSERSRVQAALEAGVDTFIVKPVSVRALADHIDYALNGPRPAHHGAGAGKRIPAYIFSG